MTATDHDRYQDLAGMYALDALDTDERAAFEAHLSGCDACRAEVDSLMPVVLGLAAGVPQVDPPPALRDRVLASVDDGDRRPAMPIGGRGGRARAARDVARGPVLGWLAAAAAIVVAAGLGLYTVRLNDRIEALEARLRDADAQLARASVQVAEARAAAVDAASTTNVLLAPDVQRVDLAGQPPARAASGRAYWSRSRGLVFAAVGLPPPPAGKTYQVWIVTPQAPVSAGLVKPDPSGLVTARFATPPSLPTPVAMAVTIEPEGGVPAPTGEKYLIGMVGE